jgi:hypothetical protein
VDGLLKRRFSPIEPAARALMVNGLVIGLPLNSRTASSGVSNSVKAALKPSR